MVPCGASLLLPVYRMQLLVFFRFFLDYCVPVENNILFNRVMTNEFPTLIDWMSPFRLKGCWVVFLILFFNFENITC